MSPDEFAACVHPREYARLVLALIFAVPISLAMLILVFTTSGLALVIVLFLALLVWFAFEITYATLLGHWILVSDYNYPRLKQLLDEVKREIGVTTRIDMIVFEQGAFNSAMQVLFARRAIYIFSEMLEQGVSDDELRWIIGRFVGHIRAKRRMGPISWIISAAEYLGVFNIFIYPYVRATVYTGDRAGLAAINGNISTAVSAMNKLMVGRQLGYSVNPEGIVRQSKRVQGSFFGFLGRLASPLPYMITRYVDLLRFSEQRFPAQYAEFATLNPGFQVAGGTNKLLQASEAYTSEERNSFAGRVGWVLLGSAVGSLLISIIWIQAFGFAWAPKHRDYVQTTTEEPAATETTPAYPDAAPAAPAPAESFGAYATSSSQGVYASWTGASTQYDAEQQALQQCRSHNLAPTDCVVMSDFKNECAALGYTHDSYGAVIWTPGYGSTADDARQNALNSCGSGGASCDVTPPVCSLQQ